MPNLRTTRNETRQRQDEALRLREQGLSLRTIADQLGYGRGTGAVSRAISTAARRRDARSLRASGVGRRFGVEIEFVGLTPSSAAAAIRAAGFQAESESYNHSTRSYWKIVHDASCGYEAVSPILTGEAGITEMKAVMKALREAGARVNGNCGLHVHHDMADLTGDEIARFFLSYVDHQSTINGFVAPSRRNRSQWCRSWSSEMANRVADGFRMNRQANGGHSRYMSINVASFPRYGTIEIRQHGGTLNGTKAAAWVRMGWALINVAQSTSAGVLRDGAANFLADLGYFGNLPAADRAYLAGRAGVAA